MKRQIIPSLIAKNQRELDLKFNNVKDYSNVFHLDVMDGKFVRNKSLMFDFLLPREKTTYEAHLMIQNPEKWINQNYKKVNTIILHIESQNKGKEIKDLIRLVKSKSKRVGIAINPKTKVKEIIPYLNLIDRILIMTVNPGRYGSRFLSNNLKKVKQLRNINPKLDIEVDGGINNKTIIDAKKVGVNLFVSGSYLQNSDDINSSMKKLMEKIK